MKFELRFIEDTQVQTTWWKPSGDYAKGAWWVIFKGMKVRQASLIEVELWQQLESLRAQAVAAIQPFDQYANVAKFGGMPSEALKKIL